MTPPPKAKTAHPSEAWAKNAPALAAWSFKHQINRSDAFGHYYGLADREKRGQSAFTDKRKLTPNVLLRHFVGMSVGDVIGLHSTARNEKGECSSRWLAIDIDCHADSDDPDANRKAALAWYDRAKAIGFRPILEDSNGTGGYHLWLVFDGPVPTDRVFAFGRWLTRDWRDHGLNEPAELFPKQSELGGKGYGNWLRLPGRHHTRDHWSKVWDGSKFLDGDRAIKIIVQVVGTSPDAIPAEALEHKDASKVQDALEPKTTTKPKASPSMCVKNPSGYAAAALKGECEAVASAREKTRNNRLNTASIKMSKYVANGSIGRGEVEGELLAAGLKCGLTEGACRATIASGMGAGLASPRVESNGNGRAPHGRVETTSDAGGVNEAPDDPHRLARVVRSRFVDAEGHPTLVFYRSNFYTYNGTSYRPDPILISKNVVDEVKAEIDRQNLAAIAASTRRGRGDEDTRGLSSATARLPIAKKVTTGLIRNVVQALAAMCGIDREGDAPFWIDPREGDPDPRDIIPARNGLLDIGGDVPSLLAHSPRFFSTHALGYDYDQNSHKPMRWMAFLADQWEGDGESVDTLHEMLGDMLAPDDGIHALHLWIGPPRSGRGTMRELAYELIGRWNVTATSPASLASPFGLESLIDKKLAVMGDVRTGDAHDSAIMMDRLLRITGGDPVEVNRKNKTILPDVKMHLRLLLISNEMPNFRDSSGAIVARYVILATTKTIPKELRNPRLAEELMAELPGILNEAIVGLKRLRARGRFLQPKSSEHLLDDADDIASPVRVFVEERKYSIGNSESIPTSTLFDEWKEWAMKNGYQVGNIGTFGKNLKAAYPHVRKARPRDDGERRNPTYEGIGEPLPCF